MHLKCCTGPARAHLALLLLRGRWAQLLRGPASLISPEVSSLLAATAHPAGSPTHHLTRPDLGAHGPSGRFCHAQLTMPQSIFQLGIPSQLGESCPTELHHPLLSDTVGSCLSSTPAAAVQPPTAAGGSLGKTLHAGAPGLTRPLTEAPPQPLSHSRARSLTLFSVSGLLEGGGSGVLK